MEFSPKNPVVKICLQAMALEAQENAEAAGKLFLEAWSEAKDDLERFISAHFVARSQRETLTKLKWLETALGLALKINDDSVKSAFPLLYSEIARCYKDVGKSELAKMNEEKAHSIDITPSDRGPFFHGTKADLKTGELLRAGESSNYKSGLKMNHVYFTALAHGAGLAAELAKGDQSGRVYVVEPTGPFENDPNVTNQKFPGNPTRSYRSLSPLKIVGEIADWAKLTPEELQKFRERVASNQGEIIN